MSILQGLNARQRAAAIGLGIVGLLSLGTVGNAYLHGTQNRKSPQAVSSKLTVKSPHSRASAKTSAKKRPPLGSVNINTATEQELCELPGVGPSTAKKILEYRSAHGAFESVDDLDKVKGIGPKKLANMRPYCRL